jgi:hypothetical protein
MSKALPILTMSTLLFVGLCQAQEKKISRSELPPKVEQTVKEVSKGATIRGFAQEIENGQQTYEVQMLVAGHSKDVQMSAEGEVLEVEEQVEMSSLSSEVTQGLQQLAGKGKITKVESITKKDKLVAYEAQVKNGKKAEVQVGPDGKPLDHEE